MTAEFCKRRKPQKDAVFFFDFDIFHQRAQKFGSLLLRQFGPHVQHCAPGLLYLIGGRPLYCRCLDFLLRFVKGGSDLLFFLL
ncbi:MAG TPA: hypothetical protein VFB38_14245 [Chthonomonadaceae bacterium]|nr:hypothetical protein [Chthonomonadaceae bacterium]